MDSKIDLNLHLLFLAIIVFPSTALRRAVHLELVCPPVWQTRIFSPKEEDTLRVLTHLELTQVAQGSQRFIRALWIGAIAPIPCSTGEFLPRRDPYIWCTRDVGTEQEESGWFAGADRDDYFPFLMAAFFSIEEANAWINKKVAEEQAKQRSEALRRRWG